MPHYMQTYNKNTNRGIVSKRAEQRHFVYCVHQVSTNGNSRSASPSYQKLLWHVNDGNFSNCHHQIGKSSPLHISKCGIRSPKITLISLLVLLLPHFFPLSTSSNIKCLECAVQIQAQRSYNCYLLSLFRTVTYFNQSSEQSIQKERRQCLERT